MTPDTLNTRAVRLCQQLIDRALELRVQLLDNGVDPPVVDCGVNVTGSLEAGLRLSEICMGGLGKVTLSGSTRWFPFSQLTVWTDDPLGACLLSQYAGWQIQLDEFQAMGSGPMRALAQVEDLFTKFPYKDASNASVGVIESSSLPPANVGHHVADRCGISPRRLTMLIAATNSLAGSMQIVARSVETAMHKLLELQFDVGCVRSGLGTAPLPPPGGKSLVAMGRTNDAILYGASVVLWCDCSDDRLAEIAPLVPSCSSSDYGRPFAELFAAYDHDFYRMDKLLFSPAAISLINIRSGQTFSAGQVNEDLVKQSFLSDPRGGGNA